MPRNPQVASLADAALKKTTPGKRGGKRENAGAPELYDVDTLKRALQGCNGKMLLAAESLGMPGRTMSDYVRRYGELQDIVDDARARLVDEAETSLENAVLKGEAWAVTLTLKTLGKDRGYVEEKRLTGADGGPITFAALMAVADAAMRDDPDGQRDEEDIEPDVITLQAGKGYSAPRRK